LGDLWGYLSKLIAFPESSITLWVPHCYRTKTYTCQPVDSPYVGVEIEKAEVEKVYISKR
jgi:hypothetical protein